MNIKKQKRRAVKYGFGLFVFCAFFAGTTAIKARVTDSGRGWSWGGGTEVDGAAPWSGTNTNVGWISMNNLNCDTDGNGTSNGAGFCPAAGTPIGAYGVHVPATGNLSGYAWSENLGWIAFDNSGGYLTGCPAGNGACTARRNGGNIEGWARFTSIATAAAAGNSGGWQGWIKLNGAGYGLVIANMDGTGATKTYAWSDELGFIDFSRTSIVPVNNLKICRNSCSDASGLPVPNGGNETMFTSATANYKACYNVSSLCDTAGGDVTSSASWSATGTTVSVGASTGVVASASTAGSGNITATYNPGTGNISSAFTMTVNLPPVTCGSAETGGPYDTAPTTNLCSDSSTPSVTPVGANWTWTCGGNSCSVGKSNIIDIGTWREVAP